MAAVMVDRLRIQELFRPMGLSPYGAEGALTVSRMLAAYRLLPHGTGRSMGFRDEERELTGPDWLAMVEGLANKWRAEHRKGSNPFLEPTEKLPAQPGVLEALRRRIFDATRDGMPDWLLLDTLELAHPRDFFSGRLEPAIAQFIADLAMAGGCRRVYCGYDMSAELALKIASRKGVEVRLDVQNSDLAATIECLGVAFDLALQVRRGDPLRLAQKERAESPLVRDEFDAALVLPPFNMGKPELDEGGLGLGLPSANNVEAAAVELALWRSPERALCIVPKSFLFKTTRADQAFKESAIRHLGLAAVVGLPAGSFAGTTLAPAVVLFGKEAKGIDSILLVDAARERNELPDRLLEIVRGRETAAVSALVSVEEIARNDFNLSVERYVLDESAQRLRAFAANTPMAVLEELVDIHRPQAIPRPKPGVRPLDHTVLEVGAADIDEAGIVRPPAKVVNTSAEATQQIRKATLEAGDILLVVKGSVGKVGYVREVPPEGTVWIASQSFVILRVRRHGPVTEPLVLFRFLTSGIGHELLQSLRVGQTVPGLQMADVRRLQVAVPPPKEQTKIGEQVRGLFQLQDTIRELETELASRQGEIWPDTHGARKKRSVEITTI